MTDLSRLALNTATLGGNLEGYGAGWSPEQIIEACAERGIGGIVFWRRELAGRAAAIGAFARAAGLRVDGLCRTPYLTGRQAGSDDDVRRAIDDASELGAPVLTIVTGGTDPDTSGLDATLSRLVDRVGVFAEAAAAAGVSLALEPLNPMFGGNRTCLFTARDAIEVARRTGMSNVGIAVDVYHVWWDRTLADTLKGRGDIPILGLHLCDWREETRDMLLDRAMMGDGVADIPAIRRAVFAAGYDGPEEVEVFSALDWWARDPGEVLDTVVHRYLTVC